MLSNMHIMTYLHKIVELTAFPDDGLAESSAVDAGIGSDFDIIVDFHDTGLRNFDVPPVAKLKSKSVRTDYSTAVNDGAISHRAAMHDGDARMQQAVIADTRILTDVGICADGGAAADHGAVFNHCVGLNAHAFAESNIFSDHRGGMDSLRQFHGRWCKSRENFPEG